MIKQYINVNESDSSEYIKNDKYSYHIGFVYDNTKDDQPENNNFGYIIANKKQFGLSYSALLNHLEQTSEKCYNYSNILYNKSAYFLEQTENNLVDLIGDHSMVYHTNELLNCTNSSHVEYLNEIRANKSVLKTNFINSVTIKLRPTVSNDNDGDAKVYMIIRDIYKLKDSTDPSVLVKCPRSINSIVQKDNAGQYVTFYFDPVIIEDGEYANGDIATYGTERYGFGLIDATGNSKVINCHVLDTEKTPEPKEQDIICMTQSHTRMTTWQPAFGVNVANMFNRDIAEFDYHSLVDWDSDYSLRLTYFTENGNYIIKGQHINTDDDLPIMNGAPGHTIYGHLQVLNSSLTNGNGANTDCSVTQILNLSNRHGGDGHVYVRTGNGRTISNLKNDTSLWSTWEKLMGIFEKNAVTNITDLNNYTTNGMYSGIYVNPSAQNGELSGITFPHRSVFLIITINGYIAGDIYPKNGIVQITQLIYILPVALTSNYNDYKPKLYIRYGHYNNNTWTWETGERLITSSEFKSLEDRITALENK